jgi:lambda repressor-like predicted transcriptional regulator
VLSLRGLSKATGLSINTLRAIERSCHTGEVRHVLSETVHSLAAVLEASPRELLKD